MDMEVNGWTYVSISSKTWIKVNCQTCHGNISPCRRTSAHTLQPWGTRQRISPGNLRFWWLVYMVTNVLIDDIFTGMLVYASMLVWWQMGSLSITNAMFCPVQTKPRKLCFLCLCHLQRWMNTLLLLNILKYQSILIHFWDGAECPSLTPQIYSITQVLNALKQTLWAIMESKYRPYLAQTVCMCTFLD